MRNWLVAVDDSMWASYAFNFVVDLMDKTNDHVFLMNVCDEPARVFVGYASTSLLESLQKVEDEKARKILVHYGRKCKDLGIQCTMMKGSESNAGSALCKAVKNFNIHTLVLGRRSMGSVERFFVGSTSKYCLEHAECNVLVIKNPYGGEEEHDSRSKIIQAEEAERVRRIEEDHKMEQVDEKTRLHELEAVKKLEEAERSRRLEEGDYSKAGIDKKVHFYKFIDDVKHAKEEGKAI